MIANYSTWRGKAEGESLTWQEKMHKAAGLLTAGKITIHPSHRRRDIRRAVIQDARVALDPSKRIKVQTESFVDKDGEQWEREIVSCPGVIRMVLDSDVPHWKDPMNAENVMAIIQAGIEDELNRRLGPVNTIEATQ